MWVYWLVVKGQHSEDVSNTDNSVNQWFPNDPKPSPQDGGRGRETVGFFLPWLQVSWESSAGLQSWPTPGHAAWKRRTHMTYAGLHRLSYWTNITKIWNLKFEFPLFFCFFLVLQTPFTSFSHLVQFRHLMEPSQNPSLRKSMKQWWDIIRLSL